MSAEHSHNEPPEGWKNTFLVAWFEMDRVVTEDIKTGDRKLSLMLNLILVRPQEPDDEKAIRLVFEPGVEQSIIDTVQHMMDDHNEME